MGPATLGLDIGQHLVANAIMPAPPNVVRTQNFMGNNHWEREIDGACRPFVGRIAELVFYGRAFNENERAATEDYLVARWLTSDR